MNDEVISLKKEILNKVKDYYNLAFKIKDFEVGDTIHYAGRYFDQDELINLVDSSLEFWLTSGRYCNEFESNLANFLNLKYALLLNSGSSANLVAFSSLTSPLLKERQIKKNDEVICVAAGFPTTINPILQNHCTPVFLDVDLNTVNIKVDDLENAVSKNTKAVMIAHTLGNPFDIESIKKFCEKYNLWLIEDNCDALGSTYTLDGVEGKTGTFGDIGTSSFYPPHHITTGEGGALYTNNKQLKKIAASFRDWGRDCWCDSGKDDTCKKRFNWQLGDLPHGYDHKYIYSHIGYNLKATEMQASIGVAQLKKLDFFSNKRRENWKYLREGLDHLKDYFIFQEPSKNSNPSWFGFLITLRDNSVYLRNDFVKYLESKKIQTRMLFAGNYLQQPALTNYQDKNKPFKIIGDIKNTNKIMRDSFWIGVYPGMNNTKKDYMIDTLTKFIKK